MSFINDALDIFDGPTQQIGEATGNEDLADQLGDPLDIAGIRGGKASRAAAEALIRAVNEAIGTSKKFDKRIARTLRKSGKKAIKELRPLANTGLSALAEIESLVNDPNAQQDFVSNNPFFKALADDAERRIFNNQAARGKVGSGGTAEALQNSLLLLGNDLVGEQISRQGALAQPGINALGQISNIRQDTGIARASALGAGRNTLTDLITQRGNATATGIIGPYNAQQQGINNGIEGFKTVASFWGGGAA